MITSQDDFKIIQKRLSLHLNDGWSINIALRKERINRTKFYCLFFESQEYKDLIYKFKKKNCGKLAF